MTAPRSRSVPRPRRSERRHRLRGAEDRLRPDFRRPSDFGALCKTRGAAVPASEFGDLDLVLVSHAAHADNLDRSGRAFAFAAPRLLTNASSAAALGTPAQSMRLWETVDVAPLHVTTVPALHGPIDGELDAPGFVNCEVI